MRASRASDWTQWLRERGLPFSLSLSLSRHTLPHTRFSIQLTSSAAFSHESLSDMEGTEREKRGLSKTEGYCSSRRGGKLKKKILRFFFQTRVFPGRGFFRRNGCLAGTLTRRGAARRVCLFALWWRKEKRARRTPRREPGFERSERARAREQTALRKETAEFCVHQRPHSFASPFFFLDSPMLSRKTTE